MCKFDVTYVDCNMCTRVPELIEHIQVEARIASPVCLLLKDNVVMQQVYKHCLNSCWDECSTRLSPEPNCVSDIDHSTLCKYMGTGASAAWTCKTIAYTWKRNNRQCKCRLQLFGLAVAAQHQTFHIRSTCYYCILFLL